MKRELLEELRNKILSDLSCPLKNSAKNLVFGKGNPDAQILFIGEAPGEQEDIQGIPFVGSAGRELNKLLSLINLSLEDVYIVNILKYRPPNNRDPTIEEIERHTPYLIEQIKVIRPKLICTLGNYSTKFVLADFKVKDMKKIGGVSFIHGNPIPKKIDDLDFFVFPLYHPAAMLYNPKLRETLSEDFLSLGEFLKNDNK